MSEISRDEARHRLIDSINEAAVDAKDPEKARSAGEARMRREMDQIFANARPAGTSTYEAKPAR